MTAKVCNENCPVNESAGSIRVALRVAHLPVHQLNDYNRLLALAAERFGADAQQFTVSSAGGKQHTIFKTLQAFDVIHWHWLEGLYTARILPVFLYRIFKFRQLLLRLKSSGKRQVFTIHNLYPHEHKFKFLHKLVYRQVGKIADRLIVHHAAAIPAVAELYGNSGSICVIPHPSYPVTTPSAGISELRFKHGLTDYSRWVILFGGIRPYKNIEALLRASSFLAASGIGVLIAGPCNNIAYMEKCRTLASDNVRFRPGQLPAEELCELIVASDIVCLPYAESLTSGAAHLAISIGRPIICTNARAFIDIIGSGLATEVSLDPPADLALQIRKAIDSPLPDYNLKREEFLGDRSLEKIGRHLLSAYGIQNEA